VLNPSEKTEGIKKYWGSKSLKNAVKRAEEVVSFSSNILFMLAELTRGTSVQATLS